MVAALTVTDPDANTGVPKFLVPEIVNVNECVCSNDEDVVALFVYVAVLSAGFASVLTTTDSSTKSGWFVISAAERLNSM